MSKSYIIVTGATSGIGKAITKLAVKMGYHLVIVGRNNFSLNQLKFETVKPENVHPVAADITSYAGLLKIKQVIPLEAKIFGIIHSAAVIEPYGKLAELKNDDYLLYHNKTNISSALILTMMLLSHMNKDGRVLFLSSYFGDLKDEDLEKYKKICEAYCMSKINLNKEIEVFRKDLPEDAPAIIVAKPGRVKGTGIYNAFWDKVKSQKDVNIEQKANTVSPEESAAFLLWLLTGKNRPTHNECNTITWDTQNPQHRARWQTENQNQNKNNFAPMKR